MEIRRAFTTWLLIISSALGNMLLTASPNPVSADSGTLKWTHISTPGALPDRNDIVSPCELNHIAIGSDGKTFYAVDIPNADNTTGSKALYKSIDGGISWSDTISKNLYATMTPDEQIHFRVWNVAVAPDNVNLVAIATNDNTGHWSHNIWVSTNGGTKWENTGCPSGEHISTIDVSPNYGDCDIAVGTRTGAGNGNVYIFKASGQGSWSAQGFNGDILAMKFSPAYVNDSSLVIISADTTGTYINIGIHDKAINNTNWNTWDSVEVSTNGVNTSPKANQIIAADLELPSDFSGQAPGMRRCYISIDDAGATGDTGIYRFDDTTGYKLMSATASKRFSSIAYYGTYASGKLLAGEILGDPCSATVMTWFTDSPTTCPIPCWYPAMKPPTGAAGTDNCTGSGYGNAQVAWAPDGSIAYVGTASSTTLVSGADWPSPYLIGKDLDESAFSVTHNNGETWNQLALIDTRISRLVDIAPAADCNTLYLASVSDNVDCSGFDSVWRSQSSPIGIAWERVLCQSTASQHYPQNQTNNAILRLAGDKTDGQIVFWAAVGTQKVMWSPDFGDYWTGINPGLIVQDLAVEDSETLYLLDANGYTQKLTYGGAGWVSHAIVSTGLDTGYSIATAYTSVTPDNDKGSIIVGGTGTGLYDVAYSSDSGATFTPITTLLPTRDNTLVVASPTYKNDGEIFAINSGGMYEWSTYYGGGTWSWPLPEKDRWSIQWGGPSWPTPVTGLAISRNYGFYFTDAWTAYIRWSVANAGLDLNISFGTQPTTRLRICGGLESGEPITVWIIDQRPYAPTQGGVWCYSDTLSWLGPTPITPVSEHSVNYDPVSGRAGQIDMRWQPRSLARGYRIQIAKDEDFTLQIADIGGDWSGPFYTPPDLNDPSLAIPPGGGTIIDGDGDTWTVPALEAGHTYYWRVMVQNVATGDDIQSPWSWREIFTVKTGLQVVTPYIGPQLLSPGNGCLGYPIKSTSFSWSPFEDTTRYKFILAKDAALKDIVVETEVMTSAYRYEGTLNYNTNYFWHVMALEPIPSDCSATFVFRTENAPPPHTIRKDPLWGLIIIIIGAMLDITLLIFIIRRQLA